MPKLPPPRACPGNPVIEVLAAGTAAVRVHHLGRSAESFNATARAAPPPGAPVSGGRFDSVDGSYAYLYGALTEEGAFAEAFARDLNFTALGPRPLPQSRVAGKGVSRIVVARDARLVVVCGAGAHQIGQDDWLTRCDESDYPTCREWAASLRRWAPDADGLTWQSKRDPTERVFMLWGDPTAPGGDCGLVRAAPGGGEPLEMGPARMRLEEFLLKWRLYVEW